MRPRAASVKAAREAPGHRRAGESQGQDGRAAEAERIGQRSGAEGPEDEGVARAHERDPVGRQQDQRDGRVVGQDAVLPRVALAPVRDQAEEPPDDQEEGPDEGVVRAPGEHEGPDGAQHRARDDIHAGHERGEVEHALRSRACAAGYGLTRRGTLCAWLVRIPTNLTLPPELVAEVDAMAGRRNRSRFVEDAVRARLQRERLRPAIEQTFGAVDGQGPPEWDEPDGVVRWVRAQRAMETDPARPDGLGALPPGLDLPDRSPAGRRQAARIRFRRLFEDGDEPVVNEVVVCEVAGGIAIPTRIPT